MSLVVALLLVGPTSGKIIPKYVPYPTQGSLGITAANEPSPASIFRVTGGTYFWQFSFFDGDTTGVYYRDDLSQIAPNYSHHKLTCFEYANTTDLELYYQKISKGYAVISDTSGIIAQDQLQPRVEENRIVGPISDEFVFRRLSEMDKRQLHSLLTNLGIRRIMDSPWVSQLIYLASLILY